MPDGGAITIDVEQESIDEGGSLPTLKPGHYLRIRVADTGSGMDAATLEKAIEPFFSTKPAGKGTGLGLSMTHGLAMQLGGALTIQSQIAHGTVVTLWLPVAKATAEASPEALPVNRSSDRVYRILVVDDDPLVARSTVEMLEDLGHVVTEAHSGKHALDLLESDQTIDMMVTDQAMPGMTGTQLAAIARRQRPGLPILLVSGYADLPSSQLAKIGRDYPNPISKRNFKRP